MWKLFNKLFNWDYIAWRNSADLGIARVHKNFDTGAWYYRYKTSNLVDKIINKNDVVWLTCKPEKYLNENITD